MKWCSSAQAVQTEGIDFARNQSFDILRSLEECANEETYIE